LSDTTKEKAVTLSGEVLEIAYQRTEDAPSRPGVLYILSVNDLKKSRGERRVMLYRGGPKDIYAQNYDSRIQVVRLNAVRRAFDSGALNFDAAFEEGRYIEVKLEASDFGYQASVDDERLRRFIIHKAYWLGYRFNPNTSPLTPIRFDTPEDMEYLGITTEAVTRAIWLLGERGLLDKLKFAFGRATAKLIDEYEQSLVTQVSRPQNNAASNLDIFIVHGHDEAMENMVARFLARLGLNPIILHEQPNKGRTIIEKFEAHSMNAGFAVVLLSPDDIGAAKDGKPSPRARQNVILELGYFIGKLGRERVCALHAGEVELPSDLHGVVWVPYLGDWKLKLIQELKAAGIKVNMDQL
jgi:predicted nucleotide-binding protein